MSPEIPPIIDLQPYIQRIRTHVTDESVRAAALDPATRHRPPTRRHQISAMVLPLGSGGGNMRFWMKLSKGSENRGRSARSDISAA